MSDDLFLGWFSGSLILSAATGKLASRWVVSRYRGLRPDLHRHHRWDGYAGSTE